jgi:hypothetical protein
MTCDDFELSLLTSDELSAAAREHLACCEQCRAFQTRSAQLLADAALPPATPEEKAAAAGLAPRLHQSWRTLERRRSAARRFVGMAVAACLGAAVASAALLPRLQAHEAVTSDFPAVEWPSSNEPELASSMDNEEELENLEVSWPSP